MSMSKTFFSSDSTISQTGKTMLFLGGLYDIRQPPTYFCTTCNFITNNTTTETFQAGHLATILEEKNTSTGHTRQRGTIRQTGRPVRTDRIDRTERANRTDRKNVIAF